MAELRRWYLILYDIRDAKRWREAYEVLKGVGERVQLSVFRCWLNDRDREQLRLELAGILDPVDAVLVVGLCEGCVERVRALNKDGQWPDEPKPFRML